MCKELKGTHEILLIAPAAPEAKIPLEGRSASDMSNVFARQVLKALKRLHRGWDQFHAAQRRLFHDSGHPCCVIDFADIGDATSVLVRVDEFAPTFVLLLGSHVQSKLRSETIAIPGRTAIALGFPVGNNDAGNKLILTKYPELLSVFQRVLS